MFGWFKKKPQTDSTSENTTATAPECPQPTHATPIDIPHDKIVARAYEIWVRRGKPHGKDFENWTEAEAELRAEFAANPDGESLPRKPR